MRRAIHRDLLDQCELKTLNECDQVLKTKLCHTDLMKSDPSDYLYFIRVQDFINITSDDPLPSETLTPWDLVPRDPIKMVGRYKIYFVLLNRYFE